MTSNKTSTNDKKTLLQKENMFSSNKNIAKILKYFFLKYYKGIPLVTTVPRVNEIGYLVLKTILKYQKHLRTLEIKEFKNRPHFCFALEKHNVENNEKN